MYQVMLRPFQALRAPCPCHSLGSGRRPTGAWLPRSQVYLPTRRIRRRAEESDKAQPQEESRAPEPEKDRAGVKSSKPASPPLNGNGRGPKLPNRTEKRKPSSGFEEGFKVMMPDRGQVLGGIGAYTGLLGTVAILIAQANNLDVFGAFHWDAVPQLQLGLALMVPVHLLNLAIMLPNYGSWELPVLGGTSDLGDNSDSDEEGSSTSSPHKRASPEQVPTAQQARGFSGQPLSLAAPSHRASDGEGATVDSAPPAPAPPAQASISAESSSGAGPEQAAAGPSSSSSDWPVAPGAAPSGAASRRTLPAPQWGSDAAALQKRGASGSSRPAGILRTAQDALHLAQGHYVSHRPQSNDVPLALVAGVSALEALATELLQRGVGLTLLAYWLTDRFYEAGADDTLMLFNGALPMDTAVVAQWAATGLMASVGVLQILRNTRAAQARVAMLVDLKQRISSSATKMRDGKVAVGKDGKPLPRKQPVVQIVVPQAAWSSSSFDAVTASTVLQGGRDIAQMVSLNVVYILTGGNLAASYLAALSHNLLFDALRRKGMDRLKQRSELIAQELKRYSEQLQRIASKQAQKRSAAAKAAATAVAEASSSAELHNDCSNPRATSSGNSMDQIDAVFAAARHSAESAATSSGSISATDGTVPAASSSNLHSAPAGSSAPNNLLPEDSRISRSLSMLDMLLDDPAPSPSPVSGSGEARK